MHSCTRRYLLIVHYLFKNVQNISVEIHRLLLSSTVLSQFFMYFHKSFHIFFHFLKKVKNWWKKGEEEWIPFGAKNNWNMCLFKCFFMTDVSVRNKKSWMQDRLVRVNRSRNKKYWTWVLCFLYSVTDSLKKRVSNYLI